MDLKQDVQAETAVFIKQYYAQITKRRLIVLLTKSPLAHLEFRSATTIPYSYEQEQ